MAADKPRSSGELNLNGLTQPNFEPPRQVTIPIEEWEAFKYQNERILKELSLAKKDRKTCVGKRRRGGR